MPEQLQAMLRFGVSETNPGRATDAPPEYPVTVETLIEVVVRNDPSVAMTMSFTFQRHCERGGHRPMRGAIPQLGLGAPA